MNAELLVRNGLVIDGTGAPRHRADIAVHDGRIVAVGPDLDVDAIRTIDATGLVVSPGFIDSHTHLETQLFWDPIAGPAIEHGCTTVIMGNCGLSLAPVSPASQDFAAGLMSAVEQIPRSTVDRVVPFDWESFGEWVASVEARGIGINAASFVGYSIVRQAVMGDRAFEGEATPDDLERITVLLRESLRGGALGISYNRATYDRDEQGRLMAGWDADWAEIRATAEVLTEFPGTMIQVIPSWAELSEGWGERNERELEEWTKVCLAIDRPLVWSAVSEAHHEPQMDATRRARAAGARVTAGIHSVPIYTFATFAVRGLFASVPAFAELFELAPAERLAALRDPERRDAIREALPGTTFAAYPLKQTSDDGVVSLGLQRRFSWDDVYPAGAPPGGFSIGDSVAEMARAQGREPIDVVLDLAVEHDLADVFVVFVHGNRREVTAELLRDEDTVIASNDTGAHLTLMAQTQTTHLLDYWTREAQLLSLEEAVHLLTGRQSEVFGLAGRGVLAEGCAADIVLFDPDRIGPRAPEITNDLPDGGYRYTAGAAGVHAVIVNGEVVLDHGRDTGARPGRFILAAAPAAADGGHG